MTLELNGLYFLGELFLPVVQATDVLEILNLVLRILCEAWLDNIYSQKIKFRCKFSSLKYTIVSIVSCMNQIF